MFEVFLADPVSRIALVVLLALLMDHLLGEPRRGHPLVGFGNAAALLERWIYGDGQSSSRAMGIAALLLLVVPLPLLAAVSGLMQGWVRLLMEGVILYLVRFIGLS